MRDPEHLLPPPPWRPILLDRRTRDEFAAFPLTAPACLGLHGAAHFRTGPGPVLPEPALGQAGVALERYQRVRAMLLLQCLDRLATHVACVQRHRDPLQVHFLEQPRIAPGSPPSS